MYNTTENLNIFINVEDFVKLTTIPKQTLYSYVHYKQIPDTMYRKLGRKLIFIREEVIKWILEGAHLEKRTKKMAK